MVYRICVILSVHDTVVVVDTTMEPPGPYCRHPWDSFKRPRLKEVIIFEG